MEQPPSAEVHSVCMVSIAQSIDSGSDPRPAELMNAIINALQTAYLHPVRISVRLVLLQARLASDLPTTNVLAG